MELDHHLLNLTHIQLTSIIFNAVILLCRDCSFDILDSYIQARKPA